MARYPQGATVTLSFTVEDATGTLVDASSVSLAVRKPDGTATAGSPYTPTHTGTGLYSQDMPLTDIATVGHYQHAFTATISGKTGVQVGSFDVFDPFEVVLMSLDDAKDVLNIPATSTSDDAEILRKVATIEANIEKMIGGPIITRQIIERASLTGDFTAIPLRKGPVVSVVSIVSVASGTLVNLTDIEIDPIANIVRRKSGFPFYVYWLPVFTVTYTAGLGTAVPPAIAEAAALILQHLWETQRGGAVSANPFGGQETVTLPGFGFAIPNRAAELLSPYALEAYV